MILRPVGSRSCSVQTDTRLQLRFFHRYGIELARLGQAQVEAKEAYDISRRGRVASPVLQDAQVLQIIVD
jgi:hypothetical protein